MNQYQCFVTRYLGDVARFVVFNTAGDAKAFLKACDSLAENPGYAPVEIFEDDRRVRQRDRKACTAKSEAEIFL
jgi:hypothetical protein